MTGKTIIGKTCPQCSSFIYDGQTHCKTCGFNLSGHAGGNSAAPVTAREEERKTKKNYLEPGNASTKANNSSAIPCPKCNTANDSDARFCKICKCPLSTDQTPADDTATQLSANYQKEHRAESAHPGHDSHPESHGSHGSHGPRSPHAPGPSSKGKTGIKMALQWLDIETGGSLDKELPFFDFMPYFEGCLQWMGCVFCVYNNHGRFEILCRRPDHHGGGNSPAAGSAPAAVLYKKYTGTAEGEIKNTDTIIETSSTVFYLGAMKFKLMGEGIANLPGYKGKIKTLIQENENKTAFVAPGGAGDEDNDLKGPARLKILDRQLETDTLELDGKTLLGRNYLQEHLGMDEDILRRSGVSSEHVYLTPLAGCRWLIEPYPGKSIFIEIGETPVILQQGNTLRLVSKQHIGEFQIGIKQTY